MVSIRKFLQGLGLIPVASTAIDTKGELEVLDSSGKLNYHNGTSASPVVTEAHSSTLTNKTIDADSNTITNIENADIKAGAAIDASKIADGSVSNTEYQYLDGVTSNIQTQLNNTASATALNDHINDASDAHDASAISNIPAGSIAATDVQAAINELDGDIQGHITDATDAHDASAISSIPSGNLAATDVQAALDELQSDVDSRATSSALTAHTGASSGVHGVTGSVVGTTDTQTLTNKTLTAPTTDIITWDDQASTPSNPSAGFYKTYFKADGKLYKLNSSGLEEEVGSGGPGFTAGLNLMLLNTAANNWAADKTNNFNAEATVGDWVAYADAAGTAPVDMTGGSPNTTIARTTANEINGVGSFEMVISSGATRQGEGVSCEVNIPTAYRGKTLTFKFPFTLTGTVVEDDIRLFAYDITNSAVITPFTSGKILSASGTGYCTLTTSTNTAQIRVGLHIARAVNTGAVTIQFDDVVVTPDSTPIGLAGSDWLDATGLYSFTGFGTVTDDRRYYRRSGDSLHIRGTHVAGTPSGATNTLDLTALNINTAKIPAGNAVVGYWHRVVDSATNDLYAGSARSGVIFYDGSDTNSLFFAYQTSTGGLVKIANGIVNTGNTMSYEFTIPISGWSSNISMAESSTFLISSYLANGTRVTGTAPTKLGEYRSYLRNGSARTYTETNGSPAVAPNSNDGIVVYAGNPFNTADTNNEPTKYEIFVGKNKNVKFLEYLNTGRSGFISSDMFPFSTYDVGFAKSYDPVTGIFTIVRPTVLGAGATSGHLPGVIDNGDVSGADRIYIDIQVSENALAVGTQQPRSYIRLSTPSNFGSTNTKIIRWTVVLDNVGTAFSYSDSSTLGTSITILEDGIYSIHFSLPYSSTGRIGISRNSTQLTTDIQSITAANALIQTDAGSAGESITTSWTGPLSAGDVIRNHAQGGTLANESLNRFIITKVSN